MAQICTPKLSAIFRPGISGQSEKEGVLKKSTKMNVAERYLKFMMVSLLDCFLIMIKVLFENTISITGICIVGVYMCEINVTFSLFELNQIKNSQKKF